MLKDMCEFYPEDPHDPVCGCGSDISGAEDVGLCTRKCSYECTYAIEEREITNVENCC